VELSSAPRGPGSQATGGADAFALHINDFRMIARMGIQLALSISAEIAPLLLHATPSSNIEEASGGVGERRH
jgi:hypothetical protein